MDTDGPDQSKHGDSPLLVCGDTDEEDRPAERLATPPHRAVGQAGKRRKYQRTPRRREREAGGTAPKTGSPSASLIADVGDVP